MEVYSLVYQAWVQTLALTLPLCDLEKDHNLSKVLSLNWAVITSPTWLWWRAMRCLH